MNTITDTELLLCLDSCTHRMKYVRTYKLSLCQLQILLKYDDEFEIYDCGEVILKQPHLNAGFMKYCIFISLSKRTSTI